MATVTALMVAPGLALVALVIHALEPHRLCLPQERQSGHLGHLAAPDADKVA